MIIGSSSIFLQSAESTNTSAIGLIESGNASEGTIIYTDFQSAGRGQKGSRWESERGKNLLFSIILFPDMVSTEDQFIISVFISLGITDFLRPILPSCSVKWPNDIYAGHDKIAGILIENSVTGERILSSVAGIGLNINQEKFSSDIPNATSLKLLTGKNYDLERCLKELTLCLDYRYKQLIAGEREKLMKEYISSLFLLNEFHTFKTGTGDLYCRIKSVTGSGRLETEDECGSIHKFGFREIIYPL
jgi:BirA family biotin operon repressor/biotin-[acetyl-CoA-carboxylase] ligase